MFLFVRFFCLDPRPRYVYHAFSIPVATHLLFCTPAFALPKILPSLPSSPLIVIHEHNHPSPYFAQSHTNPSSPCTMTTTTTSVLYVYLVVYTFVIGCTAFVIMRRSFDKWLLALKISSLVSQY